MENNNSSFDNEKYGKDYPNVRNTDPRIEKYITLALGSAKTVLNVGAGAGSYEPNDRYVVALEPSPVMRSHRIRRDKTPAINGTAQEIPFDDSSFDASLAILTIHHWSDWKKGIQEIKRVTKNKIVILTFDPDLYANYWISYYFPELNEAAKQKYPKIDSIKEELGTSCEVRSIPVPIDCSDGFIEAFYGRPEELTKKEVRSTQSMWSFLPPGVVDMKTEILTKELASGEWDRKFGSFRNMPEFNGALKLIIANVQ